MLLEKDKRKINDRYVNQLKFLQKRFPKTDLSFIISYKQDILWKNINSKLGKGIYTLFNYPKIFFIHFNLFLKEMVKKKIFKL